MNEDAAVGAASAEVALVEYDVDNDEIVTDDAEKCIPVQQGKPGLLLGKITPDTVFEGYTDAEATEKALRNAFEEGDAWFNTGDLMRTVDVGYTLGTTTINSSIRSATLFVKAENVSTNEVGEIINGFDQVKFCNVYGVEIPGTNGAQSIIALTLRDGVDILDLDRFSEFVKENLPSYAVPVFYASAASSVTGTFKMLKGICVNRATISI